MNTVKFKTLDAEHRKVLQGSVSMGAKEEVKN
jgi:hypothetical protein